MQTRPRRVQVRAPCALRVSGRTVTGVSHNVSTSGLHVSFPRSVLDPSQLSLSGEHEVRISLPDQRQETRAIAEIVWLDDSEVDAGNQPVTGIGLRFTRCGAADRRRLREFIRTFRFAVIVLYPDPKDRDEASALLEQDYQVLRADSIQHAIELLDNAAVAAVVSGHTAEVLEVKGFLARVRSIHPQPQILIDAEETVEERLASFIRLGTELHYLGKGVDRRHLPRAVRRAVDVYGMAAENEHLQRALERANERLRRENAYLRRRAPQHHTFGEIIGQSHTLRAAIADLERVQNTDVTVHIHGETGTGKELVARALHGGGPRANGPFVAQNCAGFTESLLQSTLFGHEKGAFTGADRDRPGVFQAADGGTLFLDEVAELSPATQSMLLRVLQDGEVTPVGATTPTKVDVRLISATHKDLAAEVAAGRFREDLYYRLVVVSVELPPLRNRPGDIPLLATHFLDVYCGRHGKSLPGFAAETMRRLEAYPWPGNVRELENEIERAVILSPDHEKVQPDVLSPRVRAVGGAGPAHSTYERIAGMILESLPGSGETVDAALEQIERRVLERALMEHAGNRSRTARALGVPRQTLLSRMRRLGLE